ncbi:unnamed protein product [Gongylonema pulchrum]|uniref:Uncharacterized protein n=1 Tax=Gongylonema pulchrum TaxID=637853 RepID=A0A183DAV2_9BILA|nr:unnamed protein product [Gongylonema pulchrum]
MAPAVENVVVRHDDRQQPLQGPPEKPQYRLGFSN